MREWNDDPHPLAPGEPWGEPDGCYGRPKADGVASRPDDEPSRTRFPLVPFDQIRLSTSPRYRVKGLLPMQGLAVLWGPPKCGKSFLAFDMLMHVALGWRYRGRRVEQGSVVYAALEGAQGFEARAVAFQAQHLDGHAEPVPFYLMPASLALIAEHVEFIAAIRAQLGPDAAPGIVAIDTLNRSFTGSESDDAAMTAYVRAADAIRDAFGCLVVIVHHSGLDATRPRGHTALAGAVDAQIAVKKVGEGIVTCTVELMKDGPAGDTVSVRLEQVEVGTDDAGEAITSCLVRPMDGEEPPRQMKAIKPLPDKLRLGLRALAEVMLSKGAPAPLGCLAPAGTRAVHRDHWRDECYRAGVLDKGAANPRADFKRLRDKLATLALIGERDGLVWSVATGA